MSDLVLRKEIPGLILVVELSTDLALEFFLVPRELLCPLPQH